MSETPTPSNLKKEFENYFLKPVALKAAAPLKKGAVIGFQIDSEVYLFSKDKEKLSPIEDSTDNNIKNSHLYFTFTQDIATEILNFQKEDIGEIGIFLVKLILDKKLSIKFNSGFITLFRYGYFGIVTLGGKPFAQFIAQYGFSGIQSFKLLFKGGK